MKSIQNIVIIGAGNVGFHLGKIFTEKGLEVRQVYSRSRSKAQFLAKTIRSRFTTTFSRIEKNADLYILAVSDHAIAEVAKKLSSAGISEAIVVHTSGATPSTVLQAYFKNFGIFYPLQTFRIQVPANFNELPLCIDGASEGIKTALTELANKICPNVYSINDKERGILHVAAVFVSNFTNHCYTIAHEILEKEGLSLEILKPLAKETTRKIQHAAPAEMQTGPAIRGDMNTIQKQLKYLEQYPEYRDLYLLFSKSINAKFGNLK